MPARIRRMGGWTVMATYFVTTDNWNDAGFWNGLSESSEGHILVEGTLLC